MNSELYRRLGQYHSKHLNLLDPDSEEWRRHAALLQLVIFIALGDHDLAADPGAVERLMARYPELQAEAMAGHPSPVEGARGNCRRPLPHCGIV